MYRLAAFADEADRTLRGQISAMKDNGIELLEIRTVDGKNIAELTAAEAKTIRKELDGAGIAVWSVGSPMGKIGMTDDFAPHLDVFRHLLELSDILGAGRRGSSASIIPVFPLPLPCGTVCWSVCPVSLKKPREAI